MNDLFVQKVLVNWELISSDSYLRKKENKIAGDTDRIAKYGGDV